MENFNHNDIECCNIKQVGRVFQIPPKNKMQRVLVFLDACKQCGQSKAIIKDIAFNGSIKNSVARSGKSAFNLYNKYAKFDKLNYKVQKGNKSNMFWFYFDGLTRWIKDFNDKKILKI